MNDPETRMEIALVLLAVVSTSIVWFFTISRQADDMARRVYERAPRSDTECCVHANEDDR